MEPSDVLEAAALALINERCAAAFLHDVRGSMQALFSAFDLLGRAARVSSDDVPRVTKACELAQRAIAHHEKSTMQIFQVLTLQRSEPSSVEVGSLVHEAVHFLRNDASSKGIVLKFSAPVEVSIQVERNRFQALLVGLLTSAIDHSAAGGDLTIDVTEQDSEALITIDSDGGLGSNSADAEPLDTSRLVLSFARHLLESNGGHLDIEPAAGTSAAPGTRGSLRIFYPLVTPVHLPHHGYQPARSNTPTGDDL